MLKSEICILRLLNQVRNFILSTKFCMVCLKFDSIGIKFGSWDRAVTQWFVVYSKKQDSLNQD